LNRLDDEFDNLRMALEWALATDVESGLRIAALPWRFWQARSYFREMGEWLAQLLERHQTTDTLHAQALAVYSWCLARQGNPVEAIRIAEQSLQMARALSDTQTEAFSLASLSMSTNMQGSVAKSISLLEQSLDLYRALDDKIGQALTMNDLSINSGNLERSVTFARGSLKLYRELGHLSGIASSLTFLARVTLWCGDLASPAPWLEEALSISHQLSDQAREEEVLIVFGTLAYWQGDYQQANAYYEEAIRLNENVVGHMHSVFAHIFMAYAILRQGNVEQARTLFEDSLRHAQQVSMMIAVVFAVEGLASLNANQDHPEHATRLFAWADAMRKILGDDRPPIEQASVEKDLAVIHSKVDDAEFTNLVAEGRAMTLEQAIESALIPGESI
jgi:tetratricopeptide (TPR) repeat protein